MLPKLQKPNTVQNRCQNVSKTHGLRHVVVICRVGHMIGMFKPTFFASSNGMFCPLNRTLRGFRGQGLLQATLLQHPLGTCSKCNIPEQCGLFIATRRGPVLVGLKAATLSQPLDISQNRKFFNRSQNTEGKWQQTKSRQYE